MGFRALRALPPLRPAGRRGASRPLAPSYGPWQLRYAARSRASLPATLFASAGGLRPRPASPAVLGLAVCGGVVAAGAAVRGLAALARAARWGGWATAPRPIPQSHAVGQGSSRARSAPLPHGGFCGVSVVRAAARRYPAGPPSRPKSRPASAPWAWSGALRAL